MANLKKLIKIENKLYQYAEEYGLKHCDIEWDVIPDQKMFEIMAYRIPGNISNWKYGRDYERIRTINEKIRDGLPYEVVINSDPSRAYLMKSNTIGVQCLVMAHVIGHVSFFTMNKYFEQTNKDIIQIMDLAAKRFNKYEKIYGLDELEMIIDSGHALQFHSSPFETESEQTKKERAFKMQKKRDHKVSKAKYNDITEGSDIVDTIGMDILLYNQKLWRRITQTTPIEPCGDLLRYIIDNSHKLEDWQKDVLEIMRREGQYFWPQMKTKYMNEGFATYWHETMINRLYKDGFITSSDHAEFNYSNSLVKSKHRISMNPYLIGCDIWKNIIKRWDKGLHGSTYENCEDFREKKDWDTKDMKGHEKMFEVVRSYQDWFFVQDFLTPELVDELDLYVFVQKETPITVDLVRTKHTAQQVRDLIVASFSHSHIPQVEIIDINHQDSGKLYLEHKWAGFDLEFEYAQKTMKHIHNIWGRECLLKTIINKKPVIIKISKTGKMEKNLDTSPPAQPTITKP